MYLILWKSICQTVAQTREFLLNWGIPAREVKPFGRRRLLLTYLTEEDREKALSILRDKMVRKKPLIVEKFEKQKSIVRRLAKSKKWKSSFVNKSTQTDSLIKICIPNNPGINLGSYSVNRTLRQMYSMEGGMAFDQPPPKYLKYIYPPISPSIIQGIAIALTKNRAFYTQVLHLMNRMNLEPPFGMNKTPYEDLVKDAQIQTEKEPPEKCQVCLKKKRRRLIPSSESEWVTSDDEIVIKKPAYNSTAEALLGKRKQGIYSEEQKQKKAKYWLGSYQRPNIAALQTTSTSESSITETTKDNSNTNILPPKINICISSKTSEEIIEKVENNENKQIAETQQIPTESHFNPFRSSVLLPGERLTKETMDTLPVFKNYEKGEPTNKLYIKNLHKTVEPNDLLELYKSFLRTSELNVQSEEEINNRIVVHLMQHGRMKGQAFVTFLKTDLQIVENALQATNGLVFKQKPMVVYYCKQQQQQQLAEGELVEQQAYEQ